MMRIGTTVTLVVALTAGGRAEEAPAAAFEYLFTLGGKHGVNPKQRLTGKVGRGVFGPPERPYALVVPEAVAVDREQRIWVTDRGSASVHVFDLLNGDYKELRGGDEHAFEQPSGISTDAQGRIYVTDAGNGKVFVFSERGEFARLLTGKGEERVLQRPMGIAVSPDLKSVFVADRARGKVVVFNQEGEVVREWGKPGEIEAPTSLVVQGERVYVLDTGLQRVQVFAPAGKLIASLKWEGVQQPSAFAYDAARHLFLVGNPHWEMVEVFSENGRSVGAFGQSGTGAGKMHGPNALYLDEHGRVYAVDSLYGRILIFCDAGDHYNLPTEVSPQ